MAKQILEKQTAEAQAVKIVDPFEPKTMLDKFASAEHRILENMKYKTELTATIATAKENVVADDKKKLSEALKTVPKISDESVQSVTVAELRKAQKDKREAIAKEATKGNYTRKAINEKVEAFEEKGSFEFQAKPMSMAKAQINLLKAEDAIFEDTKTKVEIMTHLGYKEATATLHASNI